MHKLDTDIFDDSWHTQERHDTGWLKAVVTILLMSITSVGLLLLLVSLLLT